MRKAAGSWTAQRWFPAGVAALAVLLTLPSLGVGWILDDYYHRTILLEKSPICAWLGTPAEMFRFFRGEPTRTVRLMDLGLFPWWTDPYIKAEFLQALTVLTHRLDYALWPDSAPLMHAQNLLWLGLAMAAGATFYRRMLGATWVACAASLLYSLDDARGATAGFIANRNVLIAATFGLTALSFHDRWRREGSRLSVFLASLLLAAALFSKEEGIGTCAYLAAYAFFVDPAGRWKGCFSLAPYLMVVILWRALRESWGYGVENMGLYVDPLTDPGPFVSEARERIPMLLLGQWSPIPSEIGIALGRRASVWIWWIMIVILLMLVFSLAPLLRRDRLARFWGAGMLFATIPVAATFPMDRLLTFVGLGASGLLAQFLAFVLEPRNAAQPNRAWRMIGPPMAGLLVATHAVLGPVVLPFRAGNPVGPKWIERRFYVDAGQGKATGDQTLVIVNAPSPVHANYLILQRELAGGPVPRHVRALAPAIPGLLIRRVDERSIAIRPGYGFLDWIADRVFRSDRRPIRLGERVRLSGMDAVVTATTADGRPAEATFRFDVPLESNSLVWLCFRRGRFESFAPPPVGGETVIPFDMKSLLRPGS